MDHEKQSLIDESPASPSTTKFVVVVALLAACAGFAAGAVVHSPTLVNKSASFETKDECADELETCKNHLISIIAGADGREGSLGK
mmetsp:Transcript_7361/g.23187  ORF Transcript_7361/g.23187 Transcript_7361/m.23187 type:complete len:86 (-) Transcript_7361:32-289(-)